MSQNSKDLKNNLGYTSAEVQSTNIQMNLPMQQNKKTQVSLSYKKITEDAQKNQNEDNFYKLTLTLINGIGIKTIDYLLQKFGTAQNVFQQNPSTLVQTKGINKNMVDSILNKRIFDEAINLKATCKELGIKIIPIWSKYYPTKLKEIYNPPTVIYVRGNNFNKLNNSKVISIVGTRNPTSYSKKFVYGFIESLKNENIIVVSGLARGVDQYAHEACVKNDISTFGVLPCPITEIYPIHNTALADKMQINGGIISEYNFLNEKDLYLFPARNRIIAGLSDAIIIAEAGHKSGALITANFGNNFDREVFALPGDIYSAKSKGSNELIFNNKAHLISDIDGFNYIMNWNFSQDTKPNLYKIAKSNLTTDEKLTVEMLYEVGSNGISFEDMKNYKKGIFIDFENVLFRLEMKNLIDRIPGGKFTLKTI